MLTLRPHLVRLAALLASLLPAAAGVSFPDPAGGWSYLYTASEGQDLFGEGVDFDALDGSWSHNNGSDQWDGSALGGPFAAGSNAPGGAKVYTEDGVSYLRIQDPGDPRDFGYADPGNRKIYFGHDISQHGATEDALDQGVTLSFRARIPTPQKTIHPLDTLHRDGQNAAGPIPYPSAGDGYVTSDGGKGNFVIKQQNGGAFAFSLAVADDQAQGDPNSPKAGFTGLTMNEFNGNVISPNVNFGQGTGTNVLALDPTEWHEFWIVLRKDPANIGTHEALIYVDGSTEARFFKITAGNGDDYSGIGYIAMGSTATPQNSALDVDFFAIKTEAAFPPGALANLPPEIRDLSPARGARYADPAAGLSFTATTQPPNSVPTSGARLLLNGRDLSADLIASGDLRNRTFSFAKLDPNTLYSGSIIVTDQTGRSSTNALAFDTLVEAQSTKTDLTDYSATTELTLPSGRHQLLLFAGSAGTQRVRVDQIANNGTPSPLGVFLLPNTGTVDTPQLVQLTDALGQPLTLSGPSTLNLRLTQIDTARSTPREIIVAPSTANPPSAYIAYLTPAPNATGSLPDSPIVAHLVRGSSPIDSASIRLELDGTDVTSATTVTTTANGLQVRYNPTAFFAPGSSVQAALTFLSNGSPIHATWSFGIGAAARLNPSWATPSSSVSGKPRGFTGRIHKARNDADAALFPNSTERALSQLANAILDPDLAAPFANEAAGPNGDGSFVEPETLNYEQQGAEVGLPGDRPFPNLDPADHNNLALEAITYLSLPRGAHRLAVACDDGFAVWAGPSAPRATNLFGLRSPGGSTLESTFDILVEQSGVYAFRLVFFEGNGGADVEWYSINPADDSRTLINDTGGIAAFQSRSGDGTDTAPPSPVNLSARLQNTSLVLSWPTSSTPFRLETRSAVEGGPWMPVVGTPTESGGTLSLTIPSAGTAAFYRLASP